LAPSHQNSDVTAQASSTLSLEQKCQNQEEFIDSHIDGGGSDALSSLPRPTSPLALLLEIGKKAEIIHNNDDTNLGSSDLEQSITGNDFTTSNLLRPSGIEDLYRKLMSCPPTGDDDNDGIENSSSRPRGLIIEERSEDTR
jgi:hypothetical protein